MQDWHVYWSRVSKKEASFNVGPIQAIYPPSFSFSSGIDRYRPVLQMVILPASAVNVTASKPMLAMLSGSKMPPKRGPAFSYRWMQQSMRFKIKIGQRRPLQRRLVFPVPHCKTKLPEGHLSGERWGKIPTYQLIRSNRSITFISSSSHMTQTK